MPKIQCPKGKLKYVIIDGEGRDNSMPGEDPHMQYTASAVYHKDSEELKELKAKLEEIWEAYKAEETTARGTLTYGRLSKCAAVRTITEEVEDKSDIDPETDKVRRVDTDYVMVSARTNVAWPDGNKKVVKVFATQKDAEGKPYVADVTDKVTAAPWSIGNDSEGILHVEFKGNTIGGKAKLTAYLQAVQLTKLVKYEGDQVELVAASEEDEAVDFGESPELTEPANEPAGTPEV